MWPCRSKARGEARVENGPTQAKSGLEWATGHPFRCPIYHPGASGCFSAQVSVQKTDAKLGQSATLRFRIVSASNIGLALDSHENRMPCSLGATEEALLAMKKNPWRAVIEVGFIVFLFYSNLLMGEFERSGMGQKRGLAWAIEDVFSAANFEIAMIAAILGYILLEFLRKRF